MLVYIQEKILTLRARIEQFPTSNNVLTLKTSIAQFPTGLEIVLFNGVQMNVFQLKETFVMDQCLACENMQTFKKEDSLEA